jgi:N4-gp56 family major capsid protein
MVAIGMTTYGDVSPRVGIYAVAKILDHAEPEYVWGKFGETQPMPKNKGQTIKFLRPVPFPASTVPLQEGVTPSAQKMAYETVTGTLQQYGNVVVVTDVIEDTHEDNVLNHATMMIGEQAAKSVEQIIYNAVKGGTSVLYANGAGRTSVNTPIKLNGLRAAVRTLKTNHAKRITDILSASPNYGTSSVEAAYIAICHTDLEPDIRNLPGFTSVADYGTRKTVADAEFGTVENVRFLTTPDTAPFADAGGAKAGSGTTMISTSGTSADVYPVIIFGKGFFGQVPLKGGDSMQPIVHNAKPDSGDPLAQRSFVGYKFYYLAMVLNESWAVRYEVAATALP